MSGICRPDHSDLQLRLDVVEPTNLLRRDDAGGGAQKDAIEQREQRGVCAESEREDHRDRQREPRRPSQTSQRVAQVEQDGVDRGESPELSTLFS